MEAKGSTSEDVRTKYLDSPLRAMYEFARGQRGIARIQAIGQLFGEMLRTEDGVKIASKIANPIPMLPFSEKKDAFSFLDIVLSRCSQLEGYSEFRLAIAQTVFPKLLTLLNPPIGIPKDVQDFAFHFIKRCTGYTLRHKRRRNRLLIDEWVRRRPRTREHRKFAHMVRKRMTQPELQNTSKSDSTIIDQLVEVEANDGSGDNTSSTVTNRKRKRDVSEPIEHKKYFRVRHTKNLCTSFDDLWKTKKFSDLLLVCSDGPVKAHKCILSARSAVFREILDDDGCDNNLRKLEVEETTVATMELLLKYIYTGSIEISISDPQKIVELIQVADKYQVNNNQLTSNLFRRLVGRLNLDNAGQLVKLAYDHNCPDKVKLRIQEYVMSMRAELAEVPEFQAIIAKNPLALTTLLLGMFDKN